jgi:hypothetical protein
MSQAKSRRSAWTIVDAVDLGALHRTHGSAANAQLAYRSQLEELDQLSRRAGNDAGRTVVSLEQSAPWMPVTAWPERIELPFDRGTGAIMLLGLLQAPSDVESVVFVSRRYGPSQPEDAWKSLPSAPDDAIQAQGGESAGAALTWGTRAALLDRFERSQPGMCAFMRDSWRECGRDVTRWVNSCFPFVSAVDLYHDVLTPEPAIAVG